MPDITIRAYRALYESLVDFYEEERSSGIVYEDDFFFQETSYGQIHRLVELWQCFVDVIVMV